jgi:hypothetical protein
MAATTTAALFVTTARAETVMVARAVRHAGAEGCGDRLVSGRADCPVAPLRPVSRGGARSEQPVAINGYPTTAQVGTATVIVYGYIPQITIGSFTSPTPAHDNRAQDRPARTKTRR